MGRPENRPPNEELDMEGTKHDENVLIRNRLNGNCPGRTRAFPSPVYKDAISL